MTNQEVIRILNKQRNEFMDKWVDFGGVNEAYNIAIQALKEHEAVKPVRDKKTGRVWLCGNCGSYVGFEDHDENDPNEFDKYCRACGRPVLWEGK